MKIVIILFFLITFIARSDDVILFESKIYKSIFNNKSEIKSDSKLLFIPNDSQKWSKTITYLTSDKFIAVKPSNIFLIYIGRRIPINTMSLDVAIKVKQELMVSGNTKEIRYIEILNNKDIAALIDQNKMPQNVIIYTDKSIKTIELVKFLDKLSKKNIIYTHVDEKLTVK